MYRHSWLWEALWLAPGVLQFLLFILLRVRKLHRQFPIFFLYTGFNAITNLTLFVFDHSSRISGHQYWATQIAFDFICCLLKFALVYEVFQHVLRPYGALRKLATGLGGVGLIALLTIGLVIAAYGPAENEARLVAGMNVLLRTTSFVQCGLVVILFLFSFYFRLLWRSYLFAIALGLGLYSSAQLIVFSISAQSVINTKAYLGDFISFGAYQLSVLIWIGYLFQKEPVLRTVEVVPNNNLETWNQELARLLQR